MNMALEDLIAGVLVIAFCSAIGRALRGSCRCRDNKAGIKRSTRWMAGFLLLLGSSEALRLVTEGWTLPAWVSWLHLALSAGAFIVLLLLSIGTYRYGVKVGFRNSAYARRLKG